MKKIHITLIIFVAAFVFVLIFYNFGSVDNDKETKDTIVIALQGEPSTLDPQFAEDGNMRAVTDSVFERFLELDAQTNLPCPGLATKWENINDNTWELTLQHNVKFHNGEPFTADDAVYSIKRTINPEFKSQTKDNFASIVDAKKISSDKIQIITDGPDPILPRRLTRLEVVCKNYMEHHSKEAANHPIGTGPYKVLKWEFGQSIEAVTFDDYWGKKPVIKNVKYLFIREASDRLAALKNGEINLAVNMRPEYVKELPKVRTEMGLEISWMRFNQLRGPMVKREMRLAANYTIDREALVDNLFLDQAVPAQGQLAKQGYLGFNSNIQPYPYDKEKAQKLLADAGYNGEVIELVSERGRWIKDVEVTEAVAAMLTDAGFNIRIKFLPWEEWLETLFSADKAPDIQFSSSSNELFDMDRIYSSIVQTGGSQSAMSNKEIDKKIAEARQEMDSVRRQDLYEELAEMLYKDPYGIILLNVKDIYGLSQETEWAPRGDGRIYVSEMYFVD